MDGCWHDSFYHCILEHICGDTFDLERPRMSSTASGKVPPMVNYLNHDHNHLMVELGDREIFDEEEANRAGSRPAVDSSRRTTDLDGRRVW